MSSYRNYFEQGTQDYSHYRPDYPAALFDFLLAISPDNKKAWDCATGNGQAALPLAERFQEVIATDMSEEQILHAVPKNNKEFRALSETSQNDGDYQGGETRSPPWAPSANSLRAGDKNQEGAFALSAKAPDNIIYRVATAENSGLAESSISLITVATALHWFNLDEFYTEAKRVLKPKGILAAWLYAEHYVSTEIDTVIQAYNETLEPYAKQDLRREYIRSHYQSLPFPFDKIASPEFKIQKEWNLYQLLGYLRTWSKWKVVIEQTQEDPLEKYYAQFLKSWGGDPEKIRVITWPLYLVTGKK